MSLGGLLVGIFVVVIGLALLNNVILAPMADSFNEQSRTRAANAPRVQSDGVGGSDAANNTTVVSIRTSTSRLFENPVAFLLGFLNPLNFDSITYAPKNATGVAQVNHVEFLTELGAKVIALGGVLAAFVAGFVTDSSGPPAAGVLTFLSGFIFKIASDLQPTFAQVPHVGQPLYVVLVIALLGIVVFAILTLYAQSGA